MCPYNRVEVPNDEVIAQVFKDALRVSQPCSEHWAVTSTVDCISMHMSGEMVLSNTHTQLLFLQGKLCTVKWGCLVMIGAARCAIWRNLLYNADGPVQFFVFNGVFVGVTLDEMCMISTAHSNMVPVRSDDGRMRLLDFSAPFLFSKDKRYYGSGLMIIDASMFSAH